MLAAYNEIIFHKSKFNVDWNVSCFMNKNLFYKMFE